MMKTLTFLESYVAEYGKIEGLKNWTKLGRNKYVNQIMIENPFLVLKTAYMEQIDYPNPKLLQIHV